MSMFVSNSYLFEIPEMVLFKIILYCWPVFGKIERELETRVKM